MRVFLGFVFIAGSIIASIRGLPYTATMFLVLSCYSFIMDKLEEIKDKLK